MAQALGCCYSGDRFGSQHHTETHYSIYLQFQGSGADALHRPSEVPVTSMVHIYTCRQIHIK